jgi:hypothetical protein
VFCFERFAPAGFYQIEQSNMKTTSLIVILAVLFACSAAGQGITRTVTKDKFVMSSYSRLSEKASPQTIEPIKEKTVQWVNTKSEKDWVALTESIHYTAAISRSCSSVTVTTPKAPGATVKYQTIGERDRRQPPITANGLTSLHQELPIGIYFIWSERSGKTTSDKEARFVIVKKSETVVLPEQ